MLAEAVRNVLATCPSRERSSSACVLASTVTHALEEVGEALG